MGEFRTVITGNHTITEDEQPENYAFVSWFCDDQTSGKTNSIPLSLNNEDNTITCEFINTPVSSTHGRKWEDLNGNGTIDKSENFLNGWKIFIDKNDNQTWDEDEQYMLTQTHDEESGWYWFENLLPGTYSICEVAQPGWLQTSTPTCHTIQLPRGENTCKVQS